MDTLKENYNITNNWKGEKYISIMLNWDYKRRLINLSMPGYAKRGLKQFNHVTPSKRQDLPCSSTLIKYSTTK